jgi:hypothetical protein
MIIRLDYIADGLVVENFVIVRPTILEEGECRKGANKTALALSHHGQVSGDLKEFL